MVRKIVCVAETASLPKEISGGQWQTNDPEFVGPLPWNNGHEFKEKNIATFCARATMIPLSKWPGLASVRFWPDPDNTPIQTSEGRRQFSRLLGGFVTDGSDKDPAYSRDVRRTPKAAATRSS
jgi:hypothetical protein